MVAGAIVVGHAIKHLYNSGQSSLIMPEISKDLDLTRAQFGSLASVGQVAWWSATMAAGYLGDRFSNRAGLMIAISLTLMGGGMMLTGFAPTYVTMLVAMFLVGIGPAMFHPPALGELSRRFPDRRGFAISLHGMAANVGEVLGAPTVAAFLTFMLWRDMMKASIVPALIAAAAVWVLVPSRKAVIEAEVASLRAYFLSLFGLLKNRVLLLLILTTALRSAGEAGVSGFLPLYLRDELEYSTTTVAIMLSAAPGRGHRIAAGDGLPIRQDREEAGAGHRDRPGHALGLRAQVRPPRGRALHVRHGEGRVVVLAAPYIHCGGPGRLAGRHAIDGRLADLRQRIPGHHIALRGRPLRRRVRHQERLRLRRRHPGCANGDAGPRQAEPPRRRVGSRRQATPLTGRGQNGTRPAMGGG